MSDTPASASTTPIPLPTINAIIRTSHYPVIYLQSDHSWRAPSRARGRKRSCFSTSSSSYSSSIHTQYREAPDPSPLPGNIYGHPRPVQPNHPKSSPGTSRRLRHPLPGGFRPLQTRNSDNHSSGNDTREETPLRATPDAKGGGRANRYFSTELIEASKRSASILDPQNPYPQKTKTIPNPIPLLPFLWQWFQLSATPKASRTSADSGTTTWAFTRDHHPEPAQLCLELSASGAILGGGGRQRVKHFHPDPRRTHTRTVNRARPLPAILKHLINAGHSHHSLSSMRQQFAKSASSQTTLPHPEPAQAPAQPPRPAQLASGACANPAS